MLCEQIAERKCNAMIITQGCVQPETTAAWTRIEARWVIADIPDIQEHIKRNPTLEQTESSIHQRSEHKHYRQTTNTPASTNISK